MEPFTGNLVMISAMYENGGNVVHRCLDGHPELFVYPFESQLGTRWVSDGLSSLFPAKYRWPTFPLEGEVGADYDAIIDEECKVRIRTPQASKFRDAPIDLDDAERKKRFLRLLEGRPRTRANLVEAFFRATFDVWKNFARSGRERLFVGYSPAIIVDADRILGDMAAAHVVHVVRNPWSAYADTKKRPVPLPLDQYMLRWVICQHFARIHLAARPDRVHLLRYEEVVADPGATLGALCRKLGVDDSFVPRPSWNRKPLETMGSWGTIQEPTEKANVSTALELSPEERDAVALWAGPFLDMFGYRDLLRDAATRSK